MLVEETDPHDEPDDDPEPRIGSLKEAGHQPQHEDPRQDVEGGGAQDVRHREEDGSDCAAHRGEDARPRRAPKCRHSDADSTTSAMPTSTDGTRQGARRCADTVWEMWPSNGVSGG